MGLMNTDIFLTPQQVAEKLQVRVDSVYRWIKRGRLKAFRLGNLYRVKQFDLDRFLNDGYTGKAA